MRKITSIIVGLALLLLPLTVFVPNVIAIDIVSPACKNADPANLPAVCSDGQPGVNPIFGPDSMLTTVVNILSLIAGVIAVFVILIGGVKMITSSGDPNSVQSARNAVLYAVISLIIVASAQLLVRFLLSKL